MKKITKPHKTSPKSADLSPSQELAVEAILVGKVDREAAQIAGVSRETVTRWRLHHRGFITELNARRKAIWSTSQDRLLSIILLALEAIADELGNKASPKRFEGALAFLKVFPFEISSPTGPTTPEELVSEIARQRRNDTPDEFSETLDQLAKGIPPIEVIEEEVRREFEALERTITFDPLSVSQ